ncbi:MAG: mannosylglycerate hydrolase [Lachnospiraceae bacterium]|jgi:mannosylglycerate hydrolase|nr:mannosylglycerate hydrolase [Lachnospiraceae bacterium]
MADKVHIVPHFHWDREWYFTAEESKILLVNDMEEILQMLENCEDYPYFVLDGQTSILEDYFAAAPENRERVKMLVQKGRLIIGPWYTQTDEMVVGGESIVRNLLYGMKDCGTLGSPMMIGYLPDSFGQSARMPQILKGFNINRSMFWRGTSERMGTDKTEFYWEDDDGSRVLVQLLPLGYAIGKYLPWEKEALKKRMEKYMPVLEKGASTRHILVPNGHDQMPIQKNIYQVMDTMRELYPDKEFFLSRYEDVFAAIESEGCPDTLKGEFLDGRYMRVHRSIYSSRADLKAANTRIENKLTNLLEPLASIAYSLGFPYHHGLIEAIWKELMKNHAHDSIGCCCSDKVHRAIGDRYFLAEERTDRLTEFYMRKIVDAMDCGRSLDKLTVFNLLPYARKGVVRGEIITKMKQFILEKSDGTIVDYQVTDAQEVDAGLIDRQIVHYGDYEPFVKYTLEFKDDIPSMGYETYLVMPCEGKGQKPQSFTSPMTNTHCLENEWMTVNIEANGTLTVLDKNTGYTYKNVLMLEDGSDDGDGYDYSPMPDDYIVTSIQEAAGIHCLAGAYSQRAEIRISMAVPSSLESRKKRMRDSQVDVVFELDLKVGSPVLNVKAVVDNQADDHRFRVLFPGQECNGFTVSDNQFGCICRPVRDEAMDVWEREKWSERPDSIYPFLTYVSAGGDKGLSVLTNSVREYEMTGKKHDTLAVTLFRSVGVLGKEGLLRRPGRPSGIKMETPDSQLHGVHVYEFGITTERDGIARLAKEYTTPFICYNKMPYDAMKLNSSDIKVPCQCSLFEETEGETVLSTLKKAEEDNRLIARFYNGARADRNIRIQKGNKDVVLEQVKLNERECVEKDITGKRSIRYNQVVTYKLEL